MTIGTNTARVSFNCDGATKVFPVPIQAYLGSDFLVLLTSNTTGLSSALVLNSDYTMAASGTLAPTAWSLTTLASSAFATGNTLQVILNPAEVQPTQYVQGQQFPSAAVQSNVDRLTQMVIRLSDQVGRALRAPDGDASAWNPLPPAIQRANLIQGYDANGLPTVVPLIAGALTQNGFNVFFGGAPPNAPTAAEIAAAVVIANPQFLPGDVRRYGVLPNVAGLAGTNTAALQALFNPAIANGPTGNFWFPNITGQDTYYLNGVIPIRNGCHIDLQECIINYTALCTAPDSNSGLFFAINDFELKNGTINVVVNTGAATSCGYAVQLGARGTDSARWPIAVFDSVTPQGQGRLSNLRINSSVVGNVSSAGGIGATGGFNNLVMEDIYLTGTGNGGVQQPISYEFGWATAGTGAVTSTRQTSHAHNWQLRNINISNYDNLAGGSGCYFTGAYNITIDGFYSNGLSTPINLTAGEASNFRPWVGVDDGGVKRNFTVRNAVIQNFSDVAMEFDGTNGSAGGGVSIGTGYLHLSWVAGATYVVNQTAANLVLGGLVGGAGYVNGTYNNVPLTGGSGANALATIVVAGGAVTSVSYIGGALSAGYAIGNTLSALTANIGGGGGAGFTINITGINWYQVASITTGISAAGVGPTTTGSAIVDGGVTWSYIPLTSSTDLYDVTVDGFAISGITPADQQFGFFIKAGRACIRNGTIIGSSTGLQRGIVITDECTNFEFEGVKIFNTGLAGIQLDFGAAVWSPARLKKGTIRNCYIAGNSSQAAGAASAISINHCDGVLIEECRFGYEAAYSFIDETTSAGALFISGPLTSFNILVRNCRIGGAVGGNAFATAGGGNASSNRIENCTFNAGGPNPITAPLQGLIGSDLLLASQVLVNGSTIGAGVVGYKGINGTSAAAVTGLIMPGGLYQNQEMIVYNQNVAANTFTFAVSGTSGVADGVGCVIAGLTQKTFRWDSVANLWFHS